VNLLAATMLLLVHPAVRAIRPAWIPRYFSGWCAWLLPAAVVGVVAAELLGPSYAMSIEPPTRTLDGIYLVFLLGWFLTVFVFARRQASPAQANLDPWFTLAPSLVLAFSLVLQGNGRLALSDLRHTAVGWHASQQARFRHLHAATRGDTVVVARPSKVPALFFAADVTESPSAWRNECVAGYFGVPAVRLVNRDPGR
jgi:hypothetical protein